MKSGLIYDDQYVTLNTGAHRKPAPLIGAPGLVQHYAHWQLSDVDGGKSWRKSIDIFLAKIFLTVWHDFASQINRSREIYKREMFVCKNLDIRNRRLYLCRHNLEFEFDGDNIREISDQEIFNRIRTTPDSERSLRYEIFSLTAPFKGIQLTIRAELRNEFWTLTFLADLTRTPELVPSQYHASRILNAFLSINEFVQRRMDSISKSEDSKSTSTDDGRKLRENGDVLYESFNEMIQEELIGPSIAALPKTDNLSDSDIGKVFADLRGAVFGTFAQQSSDSSLMCDLSQSNTTSSESRIMIPIYKSCRFMPFDNGIDLKVVDGYWPFIKRVFTNRNDDESILSRRGVSGKPDFTVTSFQGKKSLYVTSLGPIDIGVALLEKKPVRYIAIAGSPNRWQTGRLIERINNLGTLRLAAIYDMVKLQSCSDNIKIVSKNLASLQKFEIKELEVFENCLDEINRKIDNGLIYRVERSAYYVTLFMQTLGSMRIGRVEGFQPYDEFIQRRMGGTFEFIKRVGDRYKELRRFVEIKSERLRTKEMSEIVKSIDKIQRNVENYIKEIDKKERKTNFILDNAEYFLSIPIVYYLGTAVWHSLEHFDSWHGVNPGIIYASMALLTGLLLYLWKWWNRTAE